MRGNEKEWDLVPHGDCCENWVKDGVSVSSGCSSRFCLHEMSGLVAGRVSRCSATLTVRSPTAIPTIASNAIDDISEPLYRAKRVQLRCANRIKILLVTQ